MKITVIEHIVRKASFGEKSSFTSGELTINKEAFRDAALRGAVGRYNMDLHLVCPGDAVRIVHITDVIKPSYKAAGAAFPGWTGAAEGCGEGITHQIANFCVTQSFSYQGIQEGILDMDGPGAQYSIFSGKTHLVMVLTLLTQNLEKAAIARDLIQINTQAAEYIGALAVCDPDGIETVYASSGEAAELPRVGYACFIQAQGPLRNVHILGGDCVEMKPRFLPFNMFLDGGVVSGNYIIACQKNPTWLHQENPVVKTSLLNNGRSISFDGVIVSTESSRLEGKRENARCIAELAKERRIDGLLITQEGGGHADVDLMLTAEACEERGIRTVALSNEIAGEEGNLPSLTAFSDKEDAIVSTGNNDEVIHLPAVKTAVGGETILDGAIAAAAEFNTSLGIIYAASNQLGASRMTAQPL